MIRNLTMAVVAASLLWPAASVTQDAPRVRTRPRVRVQTQTGPFGVYSFSDNRGRIGVVVDTRADATRDKVGARVEGITPGGPAEKAGLKAGDVITKFNGTALGGATSEGDEDSGPGMKLIELAHLLEPGDTAQVEYRRGTDARKATLVAEDMGYAFSTDFDGGMGERMKELMIPREGGPGFSWNVFGGAWSGIEMVKLNADLGDYFGSREGVLVVKAPEDSTLALKGGDVILAIGGRKPTSPEQAMRILRSYDAGESVTLDVLRKQKRVTVSWKVPNEDERHFRMMVPRTREEPSAYKVRRDVVRTTRAI